MKSHINCQHIVTTEISHILPGFWEIY